MDPLMRSYVWGAGLVVLVGAALGLVLFLRRRFTSDDTAPAVARTDWVGLLTAVQSDRLQPREWTSRASTLATQASSCPGALRAPLMMALDGAIARASDPFAIAAMTQVRSALAALPSA